MTDQPEPTTQAGRELRDEFRGRNPWRIHGTADLDQRIAAIEKQAAAAARAEAARWEHEAIQRWTLVEHLNRQLATLTKYARHLDGCPLADVDEAVASLRTGITPDCTCGLAILPAAAQERDERLRAEIAEARYERMQPSIEVTNLVMAVRRLLGGQPFDYHGADAAWHDLREALAMLDAALRSQAASQPAEPVE